MFSAEDINQFGENGSIEKFCSIVQPHFPKVLHCLENRVYATDSRDEFLANVVSVESDKSNSFECPWWEFGIIFQGSIARNHVWQVSVFDSALARQLKSMIKTPS